MNQWEILGIPPTQDLREIRRAYAERSKSCHPEDHPKEFARLYEAYQRAVKEARLPGRAEPKPSAPAPRPGPARRPKPFPKALVRMRFEQKLPSDALEEPVLDFDRLFERAAKDHLERLRAYQQSGAARSFVERFESPQLGRKGFWTGYFLSEEFLASQFDETFLEFLVSYLKTRETPVYKLPYALAVELYLAYGLREYGKGRPVPALILPLYDLLSPQRHSEAFCREITRQEYAPRLESFLVYNRLVTLYQYGHQGNCPLADWEAALMGANSECLGPCRHESLYQLLAYFIKSHGCLRDEVCFLFFQTFELQNHEHSSSERQARPLYEALLNRLGSGKIEEEICRARLEQEALREAKFAYHSLYESSQALDPASLKAFFRSDCFQAVRKNEKWLDYLRTLYLTSSHLDPRLQRATCDAYLDLREDPRVKPVLALLLG